MLLYARWLSGCVDRSFIYSVVIICEKKIQGLSGPIAAMF